LKSKPTIEGAGVHLKRVFGYYETTLLDPFLLMDDFRSAIPEYYLPGFPWHPHRGIETITYMLEGEVEHGDSLSNKGVISPGDVQWMTAGSGIIHQEMPKGDINGLMGGFQLWANLPTKQKMTEPKYRDVKQKQIPVIKTPEGAEIKIICGRYKDVRGPVTDIIIEPEYLDVTLLPNSSFSHDLNEDHTAFAYIINGNACFDDRMTEKRKIESDRYFDFEKKINIENGHIVIFDKGDEINVNTGKDPVRFLLISGKPLKEPIAWYGPIVMNTEEELNVAFEEYQNGTFIKKRN
jgi:redox-sensitive bicupin YhaK (pirin superfamily)